MKTNPNDCAYPADQKTQTESGLTKREYFTAMAMQGLCATDMLRDKALHRQLKDENLAAKAIAVCSIGIADALIAELNKKEEVK